LTASPKVSVIVPAYNNERFLPQCLESARVQTLHDIEVICVNDGSTDGCLAIMEDFCTRDARFRVIDKKNGGYGHSMNCGLAAATGTYVAILESDDLIEPTMFSDLVACAEKNELDFVKADFRTFYGEGAFRKTTYKHIAVDASLYRRLVNPQMEFEAFDVDMVTWTGIYRRAFLEEHAIRYNESPGAAYQDNGFWFQTFAFASRVMFVDKAYYLYRQDNPNSSINNTEKVFCMCNEHVFMHDFLDRHPELNPRLYHMWSKKMYHNYIFTYNRIAPEHREAFLERFASDFVRAHKSGKLNKEDFFDEEWARLNDIMDNPSLSCRKYEDVITDATDRLVEKYVVRQKQDEANALRAELELCQNSGIFKKAAALKRINDYRRDYGLAQLVRRAVFKTPALRAPRTLEEPALPAFSAKVISFPAPYLMFADDYSTLSSEAAVLSWYRRKTGGLLNLRKPQTVEERVQSYKLCNAHDLCEVLGSSTRVYEYMKKRAGNRFLSEGFRVFDSFEKLENHLFEQRPPAFVVRSNAKIPWEAQVFDYEQLNRETLRSACQKIIQSNFSFVAGESIVQGAESRALILDVSPVFSAVSGSSDLGQRISICCSYGKPLLIMKTALKNVCEEVLAYYDASGQVLSCSQMADRTTVLSLQDGMIEAAVKVSGELPFVVVTFERIDEHPVLRTMSLGLFGGLIGNHPKKVLDHLSKELDV
jgi:glycosyltransferase involved in cell wall biosynthesis